MSNDNIEKKISNIGKRYKNKFYNYFKAAVDLKPSESIVSNYNEYFTDLKKLRTVLLILEKVLMLGLS